MGLDMYLDASTYLTGMDYKPEAQKLNREIRKLFPDMFGEGYVKVRFEAAYWRKANHIHKWFVDTCQDGIDDCRTVYVDRESLEELRKLCKEVLKNKDKAESELPIARGFFFGGTEYDEWYFKDIEDTIKQLDKCLALPDCWEFYYHSSW